MLHEQLESISEQLLPLRLPEKPAHVNVRESPNAPDVWLEPSLVWEVAAGECVYEAGSGEFGFQD
jgi:ATP-dependent DNA ligase